MGQVTTRPLLSTQVGPGRVGPILPSLSRRGCPQARGLPLASLLAPSLGPPIIYHSRRSCRKLPECIHTSIIYSEYMILLPLTHRILQMSKSGHGDISNYMATLLRTSHITYSSELCVNGPIQTRFACQILHTHEHVFILINIYNFILIT